MRSNNNQDQPNRKGSNKQLISIDILASKLDISIRTTQRLKSSGALPPPIKLGGSIRWSLDVVDRWIENGCPAPRDSSREF